MCLSIWVVKQRLSVFGASVVRLSDRVAIVVDEFNEIYFTLKLPPVIVASV